METKIEPRTQREQKVYAKVALSIRRTPYFYLKGDDTANHNRKVGAALKGSQPLSGLDFEESEEYLPSIINVSPRATEWNSALKEYWSNISVKIPADGDTAEKLQGKILNFTVQFTTETQKAAFMALTDFEKKADFIKAYGKVVDGIPDFVLFKYCLVYGRVANSAKDINKSAKIEFFLYSPEVETITKHKDLKTRNKARIKFIELLENDSLVDSVLLLFDQDLSLYETIEDKHVALEAFAEKDAANFLALVEDTNLSVKAFIKRAVDKGILHNPDNTETYYWGENKEVCLGNTLEDTVLFLKNDAQQNREILSAIKGRLKTL